MLVSEKLVAAESEERGHEFAAFLTFRLFATATLVLQANGCAIYCVREAVGMDGSDQCDDSRMPMAACVAQTIAYGPDTRGNHSATRAGNSSSHMRSMCKRPWMSVGSQSRREGPRGPSGYPWICQQHGIVAVFFAFWKATTDRDRLADPLAFFQQFGCWLSD